MILVALIALAARAAASPVEEAIRYANALTGVDPDDEDSDGDEEEAGDTADSDDDREPPEDRRDGGDDVESSGGDRDDDDRVDGSLVENDDIRRLIAADGDGDGDGDVEGDRDPAIAGTVTGEQAAVDAAATPGTIAGDDMSFSAASAGAPESYESWMRHQRPSRWGRLDVGFQWRRRWSEPMQAMSRRYDEVLLVATWRR